MFRRASIIDPVYSTRPEAVWAPDDSLLPETREYILNLLEEALLSFDESYLDHLERVYLIGSITGFQYGEEADLDVNVLIDEVAFAQEMGVEREALHNSLRKTLTGKNGTHLPGTAHPVNFFLQPDRSMPPAEGIYDLLTDEWIKKPEESGPADWDPYRYLPEALERAEELADKIDTRWGRAERAERAMNAYGEENRITHRKKLIRELKALEKIHDNLIQDRREVFEVGKKNDIPVRALQSSVSNVTYKALEFHGYMEKLIKAEEVLEHYLDSGEISLV